MLTTLLSTSTLQYPPMHPVRSTDVAAQLKMKPLLGSGGCGSRCWRPDRHSAACPRTSPRSARGR